MKTATKKRRSLEAEHEAAHLRLRRQLGKLTTEKPGDGSDAYAYGPMFTFRMFCIAHAIDRAMVGTPDYMGLAGWWAQEYKFDLREATPKQRKKAHDALLAAGLRLDAASAEHAQIIAWATNNGQAAARKMGGSWERYTGRRPETRKAVR